MGFPAFNSGVNHFRGLFSSRGVTGPCRIRRSPPVCLSESDRIAQSVIILTFADLITFAQEEQECTAQARSPPVCLSWSSFPGLFFPLYPGIDSAGETGPGKNTPEESEESRVLWRVSPESQESEKAGLILRRPRGPRCTRAVFPAAFLPSRLPCFKEEESLVFPQPAVTPAPVTRRSATVRVTAAVSAGPGGAGCYGGRARCWRGVSGWCRRRCTPGWVPGPGSTAGVVHSGQPGPVPGAGVVHSGQPGPVSQEQE